MDIKIENIIMHNVCIMKASKDLLDFTIPTYPDADAHIWLMSRTDGILFIKRRKKDIYIMADKRKCIAII